MSYVQKHNMYDLKIEWIFKHLELNYVRLLLLKSNTNMIL